MLLEKALVLSGGVSAYGPYRIDAPIYFANVEWIRGRVDKYRKRANADAKLGPIYYVCFYALVFKLEFQAWSDHLPAIQAHGAD